MTFTFSMRGVVKTMAVVLSLAMPLTIAISSADARVGGGSSSGSRGNRTFSAPPSTSTAPKRPSRSTAPCNSQVRPA